MDFGTAVVAALCMDIFPFPSVLAEAPTPVRPFTVQAFQSPYPSGQGLTGIPMNAADGKFFLTNNKPQTYCPSHGDDGKCGKGDQTIIFVDGYGQAHLDVSIDRGQEVFIDPSDGSLGYHLNGKSNPPGAVLVNFLHLGAGTATYTQEPFGTTEPPGVFKWIGSDNFGWFACPPAMQVFKQTTAFGPPDLSACTVFDAAAIDYKGKDPGAYQYN